jgi:cell division control protein 11
LARESQLKEIEARMHREQSGQLQDHDADEA